MPKPKKSPELIFQEHIRDFLVRVHGYLTTGPGNSPTPKLSSSPFGACPKIPLHTRKLLIVLTR